MNRYVMAVLVLVVSAVTGAMAGAALAGPREDVFSASQRCAGIADDHKWLDCYYGAAQPMRARLGLPPAPASQTALVPAASAYVPPPPEAAASSARPAFGVSPAAASGPPPMPRHQGGMFGMLGGGKPVVANLRMRSYDFDRQGLFTITLTDGEVWQQLDGDEARANWRDPASSYIVNVSNGALGTFNLVIGDGGKLFKVKRIK